MLAETGEDEIEVSQSPMPRTGGQADGRVILKVQGRFGWVWWLSEGTDSPDKDPSPSHSLASSSSLGVSSK